MTETVTTNLKKLLEENEDWIKERREKKTLPLMTSSSESIEESIGIVRRIDELLNCMDELDKMIEEVKKQCEQWKEERKREDAEFECTITDDEDSWKTNDASKDSDEKNHQNVA